MRVAFLSDIHGNLPALRAALRAAFQHGAQQLAVAGDVVGEGPFPNEVVGLLAEHGVPAVRGNVDRRVLALEEPPHKLQKRLRRADGKRRKRLDAWTALQLGTEERAWLAALPPERELDYEGHRVRLLHGSPLGDTDYVYPSLTTTALRAKLGDDRPEVLVCGHSHIPFVARLQGVLVVNCGSVGRPADGDPRGSFALVDFAGPDAPGGVIVRFVYPVAELTRALAERAVPGVDPAEFEQGVKRR